MFLSFLFLPTFEHFAEKWLSTEYVISSPTAVSQKQQLLKRAVYSKIGNKRLNQIKHQDIVNIVVAHRATAPKSVNKLVQFLNRIFVYAIDVCKYKIQNPITPGIKLLFPPCSSGEFAAVHTNEVPAFFKKIDNLKVNKKQSITAFWILAYTGLRRSEVMKANWSEINLQTKTWVIPRNRMKTRQSDHIVPLSNQVVDLLLQLQKQTGRNSGKLFDIDPSTPLYLCTAAGYHKRMTLHGLRKVFSTHAHESGLWSIDAIEMQLAHRVSGIRGIYNKSQYLGERARLLQWYADEIDRWRNVLN